MAGESIIVKARKLAARLKKAGHEDDALVILALVDQAGYAVEDAEAEMGRLQRTEGWIRTKHVLMPKSDAKMF